MAEGSALRILALCLSGAGIAIAGYLTYVHYADATAVCVGGGSECERVQTSDYADLAGVPVALIGVLGYLAVGLASLGRSERSATLAAGLALGGAAFSLYLTYLELFVINAICQWCVASAVVMITLAGVCAARLLRWPDANA